MNKNTVLSLFTGAGGLDLGLESAGFEVLLCVEVEEDCRATLGFNRPRWRMSEPRNIHDLIPQRALKETGLKPRDLVLLAGGPPCQPFSKSGYWSGGETRRLNDPRAGTLRAYIDFVEAALPEVLLLENVRGFVFSGKDEGLQLIRRHLDQINRTHRTAYDACVVSLNCADYGVPQIRERVFIVAHREGWPFVLPERTHWPAEEIPGGESEPHRTAWDAIGDLDSDQWPASLSPCGKWADLLPSIPEGSNYLWHTSHSGGEPLFGWRTRYWTFLLKLAKNRPSWTIQADPGPATGPFHWRSRKLSIREICRLQTFPDSYLILGDYRSCYRQVGNAVPPAIGELLGREIRRQLLGQRPLHRASFVPRQRGGCGPPERVERVPKKYLGLRGWHLEHPGVGLGPGALEGSSGFRPKE